MRARASARAIGVRCGLNPGTQTQDAPAEAGALKSRGTCALRLPTWHEGPGFSPGNWSAVRASTRAHRLRMPRLKPGALEVEKDLPHRGCRHGMRARASARAIGVRCGLNPGTQTQDAPAEAGALESRRTCRIAAADMA